MLRSIARHTLIAVVGLGATVLMLIASSTPADAQTDYAPDVPQATPLVYGGPFGNTSGELSGTPGDNNLSDRAKAFHVAQPEAGEGIGGGDADDSLAFTGSSSTQIASAGMGLLLVGGVAFVASRKRVD